MTTGPAAPASRAPAAYGVEPSVDSAAAGAIVAAYYARIVGYPDELRRRAQAAFTISGFLATGLVGLGAIASLAKAPLIVQIAGLLAVGAWTGSAIAFARAVASPEQLPKESDASSASN